MSERWLWTQKEDIGPNPRAGHAMVYDADRERVVLFGGYGLTGVTKQHLRDVLRYVGVRWERLDPACRHRAGTPLGLRHEL